ncbi:unnamed protein product [Peniophora sp. CBMAI 1063]|nr:unnamed protein product [Peniophora sp. CBMAI 1063]
MYVAYECHYVQPKSVESYLSGICNQLEMCHPEVHALRRHPLVTRTLAGCKKLFSKPTQRKAALTVDNLEHAAAQLTQSYDDKLFLAMLYTGFFGLHRLAELTDHDKPAFRSYRKTIMRATVRIEGDAYTYLLPGHKADRFYEGNTVRITRQQRGPDPYAVFSGYVAARDQSRNALHPALWVNAGGDVPTRSWFTTRLKRLFPDATIGGHSMRPGGATFYAVDGMPGEYIQVLGRWSSDAFQMYIRKHPVVLHALLQARREENAGQHRA